ncbi:MAG: hypothetical protein GF364_03990 [Candidatus Lokiarchaeota archaeon]|nr:hypothetical protein [Candidatus Lokiarchaeota archaeon]
MSLTTRYTHPKHHRYYQNTGRRRLLLVASRNASVKALEKSIGVKLKVTDNIEHIDKSLKIEKDEIVGINLNYCDLTEIPNEIRKLRSLEYLSLAFNEIKEIPDWVNELESLVTFVLTGNKIKRLPRNIGKIESLEVFHILQNPIDRLPMSFRRYADIYSQFRELGIKRYGLNMNTIETIKLLKQRGVKIIEPKQ